MRTAFSALSLPVAMQDNLVALGYSQMTEIQAASLPVILAGQDVIAQASTGSGKTVAFSIGLLNRLTPEQIATQALVLCPIRELAEQVCGEIRKLARFRDNIKVLALYGGVPMAAQVSSLQHQAQVVVGTPGRVLDHVLRGNLSLSQVNTLVLDEADRMLDMGFAEDLDKLVRTTPSSRQTLLFSATYPTAIEQISRTLQRQPQRIVVEAVHSQSKIRQFFYEISDDKRLHGLRCLLTHFEPESCMVFCNTRAECQQVADDLNEKGFSALALHGDMEQRQRQEVLLQFAHRSLNILVATDVAARGLDIKDVAVVVNYHLASDPETHIHRIGRTGRADSQGLALTLCSPQEASRAAAIEDLQQQAISWADISKVRYNGRAIREPAFRTLCIEGGRKDKLRPGDILGALSKDGGVEGVDIGQISLLDSHSYVAIKARSVKRALAYLREGKIKGRRFRARKL
ncbi:ATP-dependent RNA helicase DbpA [Bowmanella denitrificans]|uniref:ATP-dependent RNA helicase DbpA n=1 Tax=Bowmanella denitrificans TaxID=366582 RepID=UPI000C999183|nr:ATP-dependent RNA helicase DbpA [Bowmanella denitrificans]